MQFPCAHNINPYISQKKSFPLDDCHYHWRFIRCPIWDSRWSKDLDRSRNRSPVESNANQEYESVTENTSHEPTSHPQTPPNREETDPNLGLQNPELSVPNHNQPTRSLFPLDPRLQTIEDPITVKPRGRPFGLLNKKRTRKEIAFERSTCRHPSLFKHRECEFPISQRGISRSGIRGRPIRRAQNERTRENLVQSGNVSGIPTDMTSVFSI